MKMQMTACKRRRGATAVEMAIIAPVLLAILFGIIEFGWYFMARQMVHNAASEGVRHAVLPGWNEADIQNVVHARLAETLGALASTNALVTLDTDDGENSPCAAVTVRVFTQDIALPGWILQAVGLADETTDQIVFKRWMGTQTAAWAPSDPNFPCT